jgi:predicted ester cyclase
VSVEGKEEHHDRGEKAIAGRVYEIISAGDFDRAQEIVDASASDNELPPGDPPVKLIDTFKKASSEAREGFPDLTIDVEDLIAEGDRVTARVTMRGTHSGEFQGIAPTGKQVEVKAIDMFRIEGCKIVEHWGHADDPTAFLRAPEG